jgi:hypothetical protein
MGQEHLYEERISSARTEALFVALMVVALAVLGWRYPSAGMDGWSVLLLVVAAFFLFYSVNYRALLIRVNADTLRLRFGLFEWAIPLANIDSCSADTVSLWRIGGAGIHFTSIDRRYRAMFNFLEYPRLVVRLRTKQGPVCDLAFSTRKPDELRGLLLRMERTSQAAGTQPTHRTSAGPSARCGRSAASYAMESASSTARRPASGSVATSRRGVASNPPVSSSPTCRCAAKWTCAPCSTSPRRSNGRSRGW